MDSSGRRAERRASWWYRLRGYRVLAANAWVGGYELDLVVRRGRRGRIGGRARGRAGRGCGVGGGEGEDRHLVRSGGRDGRRGEAAASPAGRRGLVGSPPGARRPRGLLRCDLRRRGEVGAAGPG